MTFNIRYDNPDDGPSAWPLRKERVADVMQRADVIGVQEALKHQVSDLEAMLSDFTWIGVGRDDGVDQGEFAPIFYRTDLFQVVRSGTFWLSESPETPGSKSWDAAITRIVTWTQLKSLVSGNTFWLFNTHFDHRGREARRRSAKLLMKKVVELAGESTVLVTGDFNATPDTEVYATMTGNQLADACAPNTTLRLGPRGTFSGFEVNELTPTRRIDYVFASRLLSVQSCEAIIDVEDGRYVSDHIPVLITLGRQ